ncbi:hypothetical protein [Oryzobacter telluris]|uniref:hypothetical protein n=1 Tax=Oryzobacter telluris TaxID=3149179 RepID=UPI00370D4ABF
MTTPGPRPHRTPRSNRARAAALTAGAVAAAIGLAGCGSAEALVGLRAAPTEKTATAPLDTDGATAIATRLLAQADAPVEGEAAAKQAALEKVFTGDALALALEEAAAPAPKAPEAAALATTPAPTLVAQSQGRDWPRAILAATLDADTNTQYLHVLLSEKPDQPFRIAASVPMFPGAQLPAIGSEAAGAPLLDAKAAAGLPTSPEKAVGAYAAALAYPKPKDTTAVGVTDPFAEGLGRAAAAQAKTLGKLATLTQSHEPRMDDALTFRLADGGAVTFALMKRTDTIAVKPTAKALVLPKEYADLVKSKTVTKQLVLNNLEAVVVVVPKSGAAEVIGASELLVSGRAR